MEALSLVDYRAERFGLPLLQRPNTPCFSAGMKAALKNYRPALAGLRW